MSRGQSRTMLRGFVQYDPDAIGAPREQKLREQLVALRRIEIAPDALVENAHGVRRVREQFVERRVVGGKPFELALAGHAVWRYGLHLSVCDR